MNMAHRITCLEEGEGTMTRSPKIWTCKLLAGWLSNVYRIEVIVAELMFTASEQPRRVGEHAPRTFSGMTCWTGRDRLFAILKSNSGSHLSAWFKSKRTALASLLTQNTECICSSVPHATSPAMPLIDILGFAVKLTVITRSPFRKGASVTKPHVQTPRVM